jgi:tetratricopeptide (TPR) repeat protein
MKKTILALAGFLLLAGVGVAQEDGAKTAKSAGKALATYNMDRANNNAKLTEAKTKIDQALQSADAQALPSAWLTKGDVYSTFIENDMARRMIDAKTPLSGDNDALVAFDAYKKAYELAVKKYDKSDAVKGITAVQPHLINIGVEKYSSGAYDKSYASFQASIQAHEILKGNTQKSILDDTKQLEDITYFTGKSASLAKMNKEALVYYEKLYTQGTENPDVYQSMYDAKLALGDEAGALKNLEEGRKKFPNDPSLLFSEINVYLKANKLSELTDRLKQAIKQEPSNIGLYVTLGNVYDNLYQGALKDKNDKGAKEYFDEASSFYNQALAKDPKSVDATYSLGALYYNKAALRTQEMNALPDNDFSAAGLKKLEVIKNEIMGLFDQALPYFQKAEGLNPNDQNTLIALTEIYARKEDDLSLTFKKRLEVVKGGGKNPDSYFKQ